MAPGRVVVIEGNVAAGKSVLCEKISQLGAERGLRVVVLRERCDEPEDAAMLAKFCAAMGGGRNPYAAPFQINRLMNSVALMEEAARLVREGLADLVLVDRGIDGSMCFAIEQHEKGNIADEDMEIYDLVVAKSRRMHPADVLVYLRADAAACELNAQLRGRTCEAAYTAEYYEGLQERHDARVAEAEAAGQRVLRLATTLGGYADPEAVLDALLAEAAPEDVKLTV